MGTIVWIALLIEGDVKLVRRLTCPVVNILVLVVREEPRLVFGELKPSLQDDVKALLMKLFRRLHRNKNV